MRDSLPEIAAWIDDLRRVVGRAEIDAQIRRGIAGEPVFAVHVDGELVVGTALPHRRSLPLSVFRRCLKSGEAFPAGGEEGCTS